MTVQRMVGVPALVEAMRRDEQGRGHSKATGGQSRPRTQAARRGVPSVTEAPSGPRAEIGDPVRLVAVE